jgi:putative hydrolase of the HAD superfamily
VDARPFGLRSSFAVVVTSASAGYYKSRPEIYWHAAALLGAAAARTVHVGDSYRFDVAGARRAGMRTVWLRRDPAAVDGDGGPPDLMVESLEGAAGSILGLVEPPPT